MKSFKTFLALLLLLTPLPALAQRDLKGMDLNGIKGPSGFGNAGIHQQSRSGAAAVTRSYHAEENPDLSPQQALYQQNRAIDQYMNLGAQLEAKKQWVNAEKAFTYVIKVSAIRDGVGSPKTIPALQHLVKVTAAQDHFTDAINYAQRILGFAKNEPSPDPTHVINAQVSLSNLYLANADLEKGEDAIKEAYELAQSSPSVAPAKKQFVAHTYGTLLRRLRRTTEADKIDPTAASVADDSADAKKPETKLEVKAETKNDADTKATEKTDASQPSQAKTATQ